MKSCRRTHETHRKTKYDESHVDASFCIGRVADAQHYSYKSINSRIAPVRGSASDASTAEVEPRMVRKQPHLQNEDAKDLLKGRKLKERAFREF